MLKDAEWKTDTLDLLHVAFSAVFTSDISG